MYYPFWDFWDSPDCVGNIFKNCSVFWSKIIKCVMLPLNGFTHDQQTVDTLSDILGRWVPKTQHLVSVCLSRVCQKLSKLICNLAVSSLAVCLPAVGAAGAEPRRDWNSDGPHSIPKCTGTQSMLSAHSSLFARRVQFAFQSLFQCLSELGKHVQRFPKCECALFSLLHGHCQIEMQTSS